MAEPRFQLTSWRLRRLGDYLSPLILAAFGLLVLEVVFYFGTISPLLQRQEVMRSEAARQRKSIGTEPRRIVSTQTLDADIAAFYETLPASSRATKMLRRLHEIAADEGILLAQGDYRPSVDAGGRFVRYQITLPVRGTYPDIRHFLAKTGRELSNLAIDGISFQRQRIGESELEAQIKLSLFLAASSVQPPPQPSRVVR